MIKFSGLVIEGQPQRIIPPPRLPQEFSGLVIEGQPQQKGPQVESIDSLAVW